MRTSEKKITTTLLPKEDSIKEIQVEKESRPFWKKLFTKKHLPKEKEFKRIVTEELQVKIDTLSMAQKDSVMIAMKVFLDSLRNNQIRKNNSFIQQELEFVQAGNKIMDQLFGLLHEVEQQELHLLKADSEQATSAVALGLQRLKIIILVFVVLTGLLTVFIFFDISKSTRYRKQLQASKEEAEHLGQVKQRFLANMSHELRTPLQSIIGFAEQARMQQSPDKSMLEAIYQSSGHLLQIVNETLDYSRIVSGKVHL